MEELNLSVEEFADFIHESARRFIRIKAKKDENAVEEFTPEQIDELLFQEEQISQVTDRIRDFVYFISDGEFVKVGKGLPTLRLTSCQTGNPRRLRLLFTIPIGPVKRQDESLKSSAAITAEAALHNLFKNYHVRGEWFDILDRINVYRCRDYFGTVCSTREIDALRYREIVERRKK